MNLIDKLKDLQSGTNDPWSDLEFLDYIAREGVCGKRNGNIEFHVEMRKNLPKIIDLLEEAKILLTDLKYTDNEGYEREEVTNWLAKLEEEQK